MEQNITKTAREIDGRLNQFLRNLFTSPTTINQVRNNQLTIPDLTIEITVPLYDYGDTLH